MAVTPEDEKLRLQQLRILRRKWLKDQELSPREPVLPPRKVGPVESFWQNFLRENTLWRRATYKTYMFSRNTAGALAGSWLVYYWIKYHLMETPYGFVSQKYNLYPGDVILETGEVIPPMAEPTHDHHHH